MTCEKLAWRGYVKSIALWVELLGIIMWSFCQSRDLKATAFSLCSCEEVSSEKWLKFVSTALKRSARKLNVKSVSLCQTGDIKATALCEVGWRIMEIVCQLHSRAPVRKVLNVKFVSRGQFALAEKISRGRSTILNFQRQFLCVKQLISQQTNFWHRCDNTTRIYFISTEKLISQPLMWCGFFIFHSCHAFRELR